MSRLALVGRNIGFHGLAKIYELAAALLWTALIARHLGREGFGQYVFLWAAITLPTIVPEIGLNSVLLREAARDKSRAPQLLRAAIRIRSLLLLAAMSILIGVVLVTTTDAMLLLGGALGCIWMIGRLTIATNSAIFFAYERIQYDTLVTVLYCTMVLGFLGAAVLFGRRLGGVMAAFAAAAVLAAGISSLLRRWKFCPVARKTESGLAISMLKASLPIGGARALRLTGNKVDTLLLTWLRTPGEVAIYGGVYALVLRITHIAIIVSRPIFPLLAQLAGRENRQQLRRVTEKSLRLMLILGLGCAVGLTAVADKVVFLVFGPEFGPAIPVMRILSWALVLMFPCFLGALVAISAHRQVYLLKSLGVCIGLNIALDLVLIPYLGYYGPCVATLTAEVLFAVLLARLLRRIMPSVRLLAGAPGAFASAAVTGLVLYLLSSFSLPLLVAVGFLVYVPSLVLFRAIRPNEVRRLWGAIAARGGALSTGALVDQTQSSGCNE